MRFREMETCTLLESQVQADKTSAYSICRMVVVVDVVMIVIVFGNETLYASLLWLDGEYLLKTDVAFCNEFAKLIHIDAFYVLLLDVAKSWSAMQIPPNFVMSSG